MKKFIIWSLVSACMCINTLYAEDTFIAGGLYECWWEYGGHSESYWWCGMQAEQCRGNNLYGSERGYTFYSIPDTDDNGDTFEHNNRNFVCCNANKRYNEKGEVIKQKGRWVEYTNTGYNQYARKTLDNGETCQMIVNPCYNNGWPEERYILTDCNTPNSTICLNESTFPRKIYDVANHKARNDRCALPCSSGMAYQSYTSDECVSCKITAQQGIDTYGTCVTCASNEFFQKSAQYDSRGCAGTECCVKKTDVPIVSRNALKSCWRCPSDRDLWGRCISGQLAGDDFKRCGFEHGQQIPAEYQVPIASTDEETQIAASY